MKLCLNKDYYKKQVNNHKIISRKGLDIDKYIETREKAKSLALFLGEKENFFHNSEDSEWVYKNGKLTIRFRLKTDYNDDSYHQAMQIGYDRRILLNEKSYFPGKWEELISLLYEKLEVLYNENQKKKKTISNVHYLIDYIKYDNILNINDSIKIQMSDNKVDSNDETIEVVADNEVVFSDKVIDGSYDLLNYLPGDWEDELNDYVIKLKQIEKTDKNRIFDNEIEKHINKIKMKYK